MYTVPKIKKYLDIDKDLPLKAKKKTLNQLLENVRSLSDTDIQAWIKMKPAGKETW